MESGSMKLNDVEEIGKKVLLLLLDPFERDARFEKVAKTLLKYGYRVNVLGWNRFGSLKDNENREGITIYRVNVKNEAGSRWRILYKIPSLYYKYFNKAMTIEYDYVICRELYMWPLAWFLKIFKNKKTIFDAHEPYAEQIIQIIPGLNKLRFLLLLFEGFWAKRSDYLITCTPLMIERYKKMGVNKIAYLPNLPLFYPKCEEKKEKDIFLLGRIGSMSKGNSGIEAILKLGKILYERDNSIRIILGGPINGGWKNEFLAMMESMKEYVEYIGPVPVKDMPNILAKFDLMVTMIDPTVPKLLYGYSTKIFDAMSLGVCVLTSRAAEDQFLVAETKCGIIVDYPYNYEKIADQIIGLMKNREMLAMYGDNGKKAITEKYSWQLYEQNLINLLRN